jgi:hypothetical protein
MSFVSKRDWIGLPESFRTYLNRDGEERAVDVAFHFRPAVKGSTGFFGEPMEPDSPAEVEIVGAACAENLAPVELTREETAVIERRILATRRIIQ